MNYLTDIKATYGLIDKIKQYYYNRSIPLNGAKFWVESQYDQWGSKFYVIRSNLKFNMTKRTMEIGE